MTNLQFISLLSPAIGSFVLVILAWLNQNQRLGDLRGDVNQLADRMDKRIDQLSDRIDRRLALIESDQKQFFTITGKLEGRIDELHRK